MFSTPKRPTLGFTQPPVQWVPGLFSGVKRAGIDVDHFRPVQRLRMSGAIPILPLYVFMPWAKKIYFFFVV